MARFQNCDGAEGQLEVPMVLLVAPASASASAQPAATADQVHGGSTLNFGAFLFEKITSAVSKGLSLRLGPNSAVPSYWGNYSVACGKFNLQCINLQNPHLVATFETKAPL